MTRAFLTVHAHAHARRNVILAAPLPSMQHSQFPIDKLFAADSVITLLGKVDVTAFPWDERIAVGACQAKAIDACFDELQDKRSRLRSRRSHQAILQAVAEARPLAKD